MSDALSLHPVSAGAMAMRSVRVIDDWLAGGAGTDEIAVLARVNSALLPVQIALGESGVPHTAPLDRTVLRRTGIRAALAYLRIGLDPERIRREDVLATVNRPTRRLKSAVQPLLKQAGRWSLSRLEDAAGLLDGSRGERFEGYLADLRSLTDAVTEGADTARCLALIRRRIGLGEAMEVLDSSRTRPEGSSHGDDLDALEQLADLHPDPVTFQAWLAECLDDPGDERGVTLSTVHRVKGMEWDRVVVFAANSGLLPHRLADDVEEERRVFHVAITRCREAVAVVGDRDALSPFVDELNRPAESPEERAGRRRPPPPPPLRRTGDGAVVADPGLVVTLPGGFEATVLAATDRHATVALDGGARIEVAFGTPVGVQGARAPLAPRPAVTPVPTRTADESDPLDAEGEALFERLRRWRARTAQDQEVPAYVVLHDAHLRAIAARRPATDRELARCPGIGPTRLERYGDDLLSLVAGE